MCTYYASHTLCIFLSTPSPMDAALDSVENVSNDSLVSYSPGGSKNLSPVSVEPYRPPAGGVTAERNKGSKHRNRRRSREEKDGSSEKAKRRRRGSGSPEVETARSHKKKKHRHQTDTSSNDRRKKRSSSKKSKRHKKDNSPKPASRVIPKVYQGHSNRYRYSTCTSHDQIFPQSFRHYM